jgi:oxygen-dependent protoporphyrinogen oxidase
MEVFITGLKNYLGERLKTESRVVSIDKKGDTYIVFLSDNSRFEAEGVIIASPAHSTSEIVRDFNKNLSQTLGGIPYPPVSVVCLGYKKDRLKQPLDGFGFLVPKREGKKLLGTLWDSSIFPNRAPEGYVLLRSMLGGARSAEIALREDDRLINTVLGDLKDIMDIGIRPDFIKIYRHEKGIPQYLLGHQKRLDAIDELVRRYKGLYITGNSYRGIGVNDCIENSFKLTERIVNGHLSA